MEFLFQPFPESEGVRSFFIGSLWIGLFIGFFLYVFEPFGMSNAGDDKLRLCLTFGLITTGVSFGYDLFIRYILKMHRDSEDWVFWKWMLSVAGLILLIALGNYLFMWWEFDLTLSFRGFLGAMIYTLLIGLFPIFFIGLYKSHRAISKNQALAEAINRRLQPSSSTVSLAADHTTETFEIAPRDIFFVEAMQNYVVVHFETAGQRDQKILRNTLGDIEKRLLGSSVDRSHRSFLVNRERIAQVEGNAQGLKLTLRGVEDRKIPVSRKFIDRFQ